VGKSEKLISPWGRSSARPAETFFLTHPRTVPRLGGGGGGGAQQSSAAAHARTDGRRALSLSCSVATAAAASPTKPIMPVVMETRSPHSWVIHTHALSRILFVSHSRFACQLLRILWRCFF
jgi:hypothetical protein